VSPSASGRLRAAGERPSVTLAIYHATPDFEKHLIALRRTGRFTLACFPQRPAAVHASASTFDGVLWELQPGQPPNWRRLVAMAGGAPIVSYSADPRREVADLSRQIGFASHLRAPLSPVEVEKEISTTRADLAARLHDFQRTLRNRIENREALLEMVRAVTSTLEPQKVAEVLVLRALQWVPAPSWAVVAADAAGRLTTLADRGLMPGMAPAVYSIARWVIDNGQQFASADLRNDHRVADDSAATVIAFPLTSRGRTIGALVGLERTPSAREPSLSEPVSYSVRTLLEPAAAALDSALQLQRVEALSVTDDLTQLYNSRYLNQVLRRESKRASRSGRPLSLLFLDLDGFKSVNDAHGHLCGSRALVEAAAVIKGGARETDVVARFGGDEFALVLPETGREGAFAVGERIRRRIAEFAFLAAEGFNMHLTVSVGVATLPDVAGSAEELVQAADRAMYHVKETGKNGIYVAGEGGPAM
jgi:diguanylate cyclase (GGDEF)-like protein